MSGAVSHLASRGELHTAAEKEKFLKAERGHYKKEFISKAYIV